MSPHEESISIPMIFGGGSSIYNHVRNGESDAQINHVDIAPTSLGLSVVFRFLNGWREPIGVISG